MPKQRLRRWIPALKRERQHQLILWGGAGCFLLLALLAVAGDRGFLDAYEFSLHLERVEHQIRALEAENSGLRQQVIKLQHDPYEIEKLAREDLGLVRPDEIVFEIVGTQNPTP
jgi:cell division protein FtsB